MACRPEPHKRLTVSAGACCATPPFNAATRARYISLGSVWITLPKTTWPTSSPDTFARDKTSRTTRAPRSVGLKSFSAPPKSPIAVRTPLTTTTSRCVMKAPSSLVVFVCRAWREIKTRSSDFAPQIVTIGACDFHRHEIAGLIAFRCLLRRLDIHHAIDFRRIRRRAPDAAFVAQFIDEYFQRLADLAF